MSRGDLANFLGLTIETVSRAFSRLNKETFIDINKREIIIHDAHQLQTLASIEIKNH